MRVEVTRDVGQAKKPGLAAVARPWNVFSVARESFRGSSLWFFRESETGRRPDQ
jgi:hypothetical protein